ncbi:MAG: aspartate kinase, partial [Caulobacterales bacterium]|nr:aspartate kinase [Caulobacterales bacterium]
MSRIVMKFGGTSLADPDRVRRAARFVAREVESGSGVAVVVSAMGKETDRLVSLANAAMAGAADHGADEYDVVVSSGEQVSVGLLALTLRDMGLRARSWLGWQIPVRTDAAHARARMTGVDAEALGAAMDAGEVAVIPGFQGVADNGRIATLGRGGSDTSAVAVAAAVGADRCDIYTDVDGVYTTDPRIEHR